MNAIADSVDFSVIRYANCWEDADVLVDALAERTRGGSVLSISSAGDNVLALLCQAPERVVAVDLSLAQLSCLELRIAAFRALEHEELLAFLGVTASEDRAGTYWSLRRNLSSQARGFWDQHEPAIAGGVIHAGRFENYLRLFRMLLPFIHRRHRIERLLKARTRTERQRFYTDEWNTWVWRAAARMFFSQTVMGRLGRDPAFFRYVHGSVAEHVLGRARHALTDLDTSDNPYLRYILTGSFSGALPLYLRPERFRQIRNGLGCVEIHHGDLTSVDTRALGRFDAFNLSDVFEYMDDQSFARTAQWLAGAAQADARLVYWNMLVPRDLSAIRPQDFACQPVSTADYADRDKAFFYSQLHVDRRLCE